MTDRIERPTFFEGQILGAGDLAATVEYARGQQARHNRYLHTWGIANGLTLSGTKKSDADGVQYQDVTLAAGMAIDGRGREIVVPEAVPLSHVDFQQLNVAIKEDPNNPAFYPVFLIGRDARAPAPAFATTGDCGSAQPTRAVEDYEVTFGRPGEELELDQQSAPSVADGPGAAEGADAWRILLGFVQWNADIDRFNGVSEEANGVGPRYAGVLADTVAARAGKLTLRTRAASTPQKPALVIDETDGGELKFGLLTNVGKVTPVFTVNSKGDITAEGTLKVKAAPGTVQVQSGLATDGLLLPLPPGVTQQMIDEGKVVLHTHLTPRIPDAPPAGLTTPVAVPLECFADEDRRVHCRILWFGPAAGPTFQKAIRAGQCDYTVIASVPATAGS